MYVQCSQVRAGHLIGELHLGVGTGPPVVQSGIFHLQALGDTVNYINKCMWLIQDQSANLVWLRLRSGLIIELPRQIGRGGSARDAVVDTVLVLGIGPAVHRQVLREDIDGLVARPSQAVRQDVARVAIRRAIVIERAGVFLGA